MSYAPLAHTTPRREVAASYVATVGGSLVAATLSAVLAAAAMRPWGLGLLAFVAYVPAFNAIASTRSPRTGGMVAAVASLGAASVGYEATAAIGPHVYLLALLVAPLPYALAGVIAVCFGRSVRPSPVRHAALRAVAVLPVLWCAAEWLPARPWLWGSVAMPLGPVGYSQAELPTLHLAAVSSVTAVSAAVLTVNALLVVVARSRSRDAKLAAATGLVALALLVVLAAQTSSIHAGDALEVDASSSSSPAPSGLLVRVVQPNLPDGAYLAARELPAARRGLAEQLTALASVASPTTSGRPRLTIMPEAAWPGPLVDRSPEADPVDALLTGSDLPRPLLFGAPSTGRDAPEPGDEGSSERSPGTSHRSRWYANSAFLLDHDGLVRVQDKLHLVPIAESGLRPGEAPAVFTAAGLPMTVLICYDAVFPGTARRAGRLGTEALVVLTDDSFAARGDVPELHLRVAIFRAVETGLPLVLAANTGPSALISAAGEVVARTPALVATTLTATLPLARRATPYARYGDWLGPLTVLLSLAATVIAASRGGGAGSFGSRPT